MKISRSMLALAFVALTGIAGAQSVSSGFTTNNGQSGVMFDVNSTIPVLISNFDINIDAGSWTVNIYHFNGSFLGNQATATGWTLDASVPVTGVGKVNEEADVWTFVHAVGGGAGAWRAAHRVKPPVGVVSEMFGWALSAATTAAGDVLVGVGTRRGCGGYVVALRTAPPWAPARRGAARRAQPARRSGQARRSRRSGLSAGVR